MFAARGASFRRSAARPPTRLRAETCGDSVSYVVTRNINYTNICAFRCTFCAFSKGKTHENLRGRPYDLDARRNRAPLPRSLGSAAPPKSACRAASIRDYTGETYLAICRAIKAATPELHIHAFSPLEISQGAATLGPQRAGAFSAH